MTKLENVHLVSFAPSRIECNRLAVKEYNRLRRLDNRACGLEDITEFNKHPYYCPLQNMGPLPGAQQKSNWKTGHVDGKKKGGKRPAPQVAMKAAPPVKRPAPNKLVKNDKIDGSSLPPCLAGSCVDEKSVGCWNATGVASGVVKRPASINVNATVRTTSVPSTSCISDPRAVKRLGQCSDDGPPEKRQAKESGCVTKDPLQSAASSSSSLPRKKLAVGTGGSVAVSSGGMKKPSLPGHRQPSVASSSSSRRRLSIGSGPRHLQWPNVTNFNCYVHSALNMMACCKEAMERLEVCRFLPPDGRAAFNAIVDGDHERNVSAHLENVLLNGPARVKADWWPDRLRDLRMAVGGDFVQDGQRDSAEFFLGLVFPLHEQETTAPLGNLFQLHKRNRVQCKNCHGFERIIEQHKDEPEAINFIGGCPFDRVRYGIEELVNDAMVNELEMRCFEQPCQGKDQKHKEESEIFIGPSFRYLCLYIERRHRASLDKHALGRYPDCSQDVVKIGNEIVLKMSVWQRTFDDAVPQGMCNFSIGKCRFMWNDFVDFSCQISGNQCDSLHSYESE